MSQPLLTVSASRLRAAGVVLDPAEAVACVLQAGRALQWATEAPEAGRVILRSDGRIDIDPPRTEREASVESYARLLHRLLPDAGATTSNRVPGALRLTIARALGAMDAPPFVGLEDFRQAIERFLSRSPEELVVGAVLRWAEAEAAAPSDRRPPERRASGPRVDELRRMLREADLERFALAGHVQEPAPGSMQPIRRLAGPSPAPGDSPPADRPPEAKRAAVVVEREIFADGAFAEEPSTWAQVTVHWRSMVAACLLAAVAGWGGATALRNHWSPAESLESASATAVPNPEAAAPAIPPAASTVSDHPSENVAHEASPTATGLTPSATTGVHPVSTPAISASRRSDRTGRGETSALRVLPQGTFELTRVVAGGSQPRHISVSPDGSRIAFDLEREGKRAVYVASRDGRDVERVSAPGFAAAPAWAPDGRHLAIVRAERDHPSVRNLWILNLESGEERRLTSHSFGMVTAASWFSDGRRICYGHDDQLYVLDTASGVARRYAGPSTDRPFGSIAASPSGRHVAFQIEYEGVWLLDLHDGSQRRILEDGNINHLAWMPDGNRLGYHRRGAEHAGVWIMAPAQ